MTEIRKKIFFLIAVFSVIFSGNNRPLDLIKLKLRELTKPLFRADKDGKARKPGSLFFHLTFRCNLKCRGCSSYGKNGHFKKPGHESLKDKELTFEDMKKIIDKTAGFASMTALSGGELFIREDAIDLIEYIKSKKMLCIIVTNGTLLDERIIRRLVKCGIDKIVFSIDGVKDVHEKLRGVEGIFDKIMANLRLISSIKKEERVNHPIVQINHTIFQENYLQIRDFAGYINSVPDIDINILNFQHPMFLDQEAACAHKNFIKNRFGINSDVALGYVIPNADIVPGDLIKEIKLLKKESPGWKFMVKFQPELNGREARYYSPDYKPREKRCSRILSQVSVASDGNLLFCGDTFLGSIKNSAFEEVWNGETARSFRKFLNKGLFPYCKRCCYLKH